MSTPQSIPQHLLDGIKENIHLSEIVGEKVALTKKGRVFKGLCPFHDDSNPSLVVDDARARFKCWGCGASGDIFDWLKKTENDHFPGTVRRLAARIGLNIPDIKNSDNKTNPQLYRVLRRAQELYMGGLNKNKSAKVYLNERGISEKSCVDWGLGVVSSGISGVLRNRFSLSELVECGIMAISDNGKEYERLRQRITIPIHTLSGHLVGFSGRTIHDWDKSAKYLNPPQTALFSKSHLLFGLSKAASSIRTTGVAVVVEGYFDVIALHQEGETRAVAGMGTAVTNEQLSALFRLATKLYFCFDSDNGGRVAIRQLLPRLLALIEDRHDVYFVFMPEGQDPDEFIRQKGLSEWKRSLESASPLSEILMKYVTRNYSVGTIELKKKAAIRAEEVCRSIKNAQYLKQLLIHSFQNDYGIILNMGVTGESA